MKNVLTGFGLILIAILLLFWNEGRAVKRAKALKNGKSSVVSITTSDEVTPEKSLIHIAGLVNAKGELYDEAFNVRQSGLKLVRKVYYYQWKESKKTEKKKKAGGSEVTKTTFSYNKVWSPDLISSQEFHESQAHVNSNSAKYVDRIWNSSATMNESIALSDEVLTRIGDFKSVQLNHTLDIGLLSNIQIQSQSETGYYIGKSSPENPSIGDEFVTFSYVPFGNYTIVGEIAGGQLGVYQSQGDQPILLVKEGIHTSDEMFLDALQANATTTWILRCLGWLLLFGGVYAITAPLVVVADVVPLIGDLLGVGLGLCAGILASMVFLVVCALGWFLYRPILSIVLLIAGVSIWWFSNRMAQSRMNEEQVAQVGL